MVITMMLGVLGMLTLERRLQMEINFRRKLSTCGRHMCNQLERHVCLLEVPRRRPLAIEITIPKEKVYM